MNLAKRLWILPWLFFPTLAHAYLDPASGSAIVYVFISVLSGSFYLLRNAALSVFNFVAMKLKFKSLGTDYSIVFYSEGKQYWYVFEPILRWLSDQGRPYLFLTSDKQDPAFTSALPHMHARYIGKVNYAGVYLGQIKADVLAMTTPQLDVLTIKRSKKVKHYAHIVHAPADIFTYRKFAFDYFDSVFCSGPHQIKSIRYLEGKRQTPAKDLLEVGCTYFDYLLKKIQDIPRPEQKRPTVLVAPTWNEYSLLNTYGVAFFERLLQLELIDVILRPHPQSYVSYPELMKSIEEHFAQHPRLRIDRASSGEVSMAHSDLLISDISGIIWDYVFLFNRPVLSMATKAKLDGFEATELPHTSWELESLSKVGKIISPEEATRIDEIVLDFMQKPQGHHADELKSQSVFHWGRAGEKAGQEILRIAQKLQGAP